MITLSQDKINSLLALPGNSTCLECESSQVEWASFPTAIFLCSTCGRQHKGFTNEEKIKSLSVSEFSENDINKLEIGGNGRYLNFISGYNISKNEPNMESKYRTYATAYYNALIELEVLKAKGANGAENTLNNLVGKKPSKELGAQLLGGEPDPYKEMVKQVEKSEESTVGGIFSLIGSKISSVSESLGINKVYENIDSKLTEYGIKDKISKGVDYAKTAGVYLVDKGKQIYETPVVQGAFSKMKEGVNYVNSSAIKMINNITGNNTSNYSQVGQQNNLNFLDNNSQGVYNQLNNDQL